MSCGVRSGQLNSAVWLQFLSLHKRAWADYTAARSLHAFGHTAGGGGGLSADSFAKHFIDSCILVLPERRVEPNSGAVLCRARS